MTTITTPKSPVQVTFEKLVFGGQALGYSVSETISETIFAWNALPGEQALVDITRRKKNIREGIAIDITVPSPHRQSSLEDHYLSCSPWQILSWPEELHWKQQLAKDAYYGIAHVTLPEFTIVTNNEQWHYRNKMEYGFYETDDQVMHLALHQRAKHFKVPVDQCVLASQVINQVGSDIRQWAQTNQFSRFDVKSAIIRSNEAGQGLAAIFLKNKPAQLLPLASALLAGYSVWYSNPRSPASVPTELLHEHGAQVLTSQLQGITFQYGALSFFQVNLPIFRRLLEDIAPWLKSTDDVLDFYGGVGSIGLAFAQQVKSVTIIDSNAAAIADAQVNITLNKLTTASAVCYPAEAITSLIDAKRVLIVDPPRAGLHDDVIHRIAEQKPVRIIYVSCNLATQARDVAKLLALGYSIQFFRVYNFFPRTPHIEALMILTQ